MRPMHALARIGAGFSLLFCLHLPATSASPEVNIADLPLFHGSSNVHPNMLLSLSVEFPTVGIAYRSDNGTYNRTYEYAGYFNPRKCYLYQGGNRNLTDSAYFYIHKDADPATHECGGDSFSGNFMNWAASSAIDMLRYALTGGDRILDTPALTVLQRAVLMDGPSSNFYAHGTYFPRRKLTGGGKASAPKQVTPFDTSTLYIVSCRNRILFSDKSSGLQGDKEADSKVASSYCTSVYDGKGEPPKNAVDKRLGEYLVRVRVCDSAEGPQRKDLCQKYGGNYKPVGEIQRKSEKLRVAAMGYLLDDTAKRYGGVLRAPMKYVGARKLEAPEFLPVANERLEWDPETGVFYNNPDDPANRDSKTVNSGVINYLNKFGRSGNYKTFDPVSELYYEGVRYLQGKQPTPDAITGITDAMKDGFPVQATWNDPVIASCQRNYIVSIADVNTHWDRYIPGNDRTTFGGGANAHDSSRPADPAIPGKTPAFDIKQWAKKVGEMEADAGGAYTNPAKNPALTALHEKDTGSGGHGTYYMAGLAYWANTNDIRLDKPTRIKTFAIDVDEGGNGQIDGSSRAIKPRDSQLYLAAKYGGFEDKNADANPFITLGSDGKTLITGSNAEWDNGAGVPANYFLAGQPKEMIQSIRKVFASIGSASGSLSGVAVSATSISSDGAHVYQPGFDSAKWSGSLRKLAIGMTGKDIKLSSEAEWDAGEILTGTKEKPGMPTPEARNIYTARQDPDSTLTTVEFKWNKLSDTQKSFLNLDPVHGQADGLGEKRVNYLRGQRSLEANQPGGMFRIRDRLLGDIVNSNPIHVGSPSSKAQGEDYQPFFDKNKNRTKAVYVGANDGMLHAFDALSGKELFAYVPNVLVPRLNMLTTPEYGHQPYVDGRMSISEAMVGGQWKTVLVSGLGGGAQGIFALDVTNPEDFGSGSGAIFEFTDADDPDMGNVMDAPAIARFRISGKDGAAKYQHYVVVASGLNNYRDDGDKRFNVDAAGALFLLSLDKPASAKWQLGVNYFKFRTPSKDPALRNGLSAPALVVDTQGAVRYAYAGDLQGNLWRFDFTGGKPWSGALSGSTPMFTAKDAKGTRQSITVQPRAVFAPGGGYVILFGTGKYVEDFDAASGSFSSQSFYGIYDSTKQGHTVAGRDELAQRVLQKAGADAFQVTGAAFEYGTGVKQKKGWYLDFLNAEKTGERSVTNPLVANGMLFFNTLVPGGDPCAAGGGRSYAMNTLTGLPPDGETTGFLSTVGLLSAPIVLDTGSEVSDRNAIGRRTVKKRFTVFNFGTGGAKGMAVPADKADGEIIVPAGRFSWREILNWQELRNEWAKQ